MNCIREYATQSPRRQQLPLRTKQPVFITRRFEMRFIGRRSRCCSLCKARKSHQLTTNIACRIQGRIALVEICRSLLQGHYYRAFICNAGCHILLDSMDHAWVLTPLARHHFLRDTKHIVAFRMEKLQAALRQGVNAMLSPLTTIAICQLQACLHLGMYSSASLCQ